MCGVENTAVTRKLARTSLQYKELAARVGRQLKLCKRKNSSLKVLAKHKLVDLVDELVVSSKLKMLLESELRNCKKKKQPCGRTWTMENKLFALAIYKRSARAYRFLRQHLVLPSESTLKSLLHNIKLEPGILKPVLSVLQNLVLRMHTPEKNCVILFDEVFLSGGLFYNSANGSVDGFEDYGERGWTTLTADHALVFMVQGVGKHKWTQPVAYYLLNKTCPTHAQTPDI
ncbi:DNA transposase [Frankliniella fusca]|uniref:DNA transposase n=1 Tax=Frankliniella fusca TaxID=407009 RepID=A0AAE1GSL9_9NEOP|nr:DNA transposase [Frankliniella fusca]